MDFIFALFSLGCVAVTGGFIVALKVMKARKPKPPPPPPYV